MEGPDAPPSPEVSVLSAALSLLEAAGYPFPVKMEAEPLTAHATGGLLTLLQGARVRSSVSLSLTCTHEPEKCLEVMGTFDLSGNASFEGFSRIHSPGVPGLDYAAALAGLKLVSELEIDEGEESGVDLTQLAGLSTVRKLIWTPSVETEESAAALSTLGPLSGLELLQLSGEAWPALSGALRLLTGLKSAKFSLEDQGPRDGVDSPLSSLQALTLPDSTTSLELSLSVPQPRKRLLLDCFGPMAGLQQLSLNVKARGRPLGAPGDKHFSLTLGPSLGSLSSLTSLSIGFDVALRERSSIHLPASLSSLASLRRLESEGSCGEVELAARPPHWAQEGFRDKGEACVASLHVWSFF